MLGLSVIGIGTHLAKLEGVEDTNMTINEANEPIFPIINRRGDYVTAIYASDLHRFDTWEAETRELREESTDAGELFCDCGGSPMNEDHGMWAFAREDADSVREEIKRLGVA